MAGSAAFLDGAEGDSEFDWRSVLEEERAPLVL